jgi:hypothetical protein
MFVDNFQPAMGINPDVGMVDGLNVLNSSPGVSGSGMRFDPGFKRIYIDKNGRPAVTVNLGMTTNQKGERVPLRQHITVQDLANNYGISLPVNNATTLRKEEWLELDKVVLKAARYRLRAWADLSAANSYGGFNGMSKMILEHETMSDPGEAIVDMNGLTEGHGDAPTYQLEGLPLPITHSDFWFDSRRLAISRNTGTPIDTTMGEAAARRVAECIEKTTIGNQTGVTYGGNSTQVGGYSRTSAVYGYLNFPTRITKTNLTVPTGSNPDSTVADVLGMRNSLYSKKFFGPYIIYHSTDWDQYMDNDYARLGGNNSMLTLRERLRKIEGVMDVRRLDMLFSTADAPQSNPYYTTANVGTTGITPYTGPGGEFLVSGGGGSNGGNPFTLIMVQMTPEVCRAVNGLDMTTVQWESKGGMQLNFKVMCIQVPQLRADRYGNCGIMQATTA